MHGEIVDLIKSSQDFVITSHVNPDGDSIGSEIAFYKYLRNSGKNAKIINYSDTPPNYTFLDKDSIIELFDEKAHADSINNADVIFILDTNEYSRIRTMEPFVRQSKAKKVCIDHHAGINGNGFDYYISDTDSPATGEILFEFFEKQGKINIDKEMAIALYTAIMTDTGSFRFPRTTAKTHRIIAELIEHGADPFDIFSEVYNRSTEGRLKLLARFLNNMSFAYGGRLAFSYLRQSDFEETSTGELDTDGFSANLMSVDKVIASIVILETKRGVKLSFRSVGSIKANGMAGEFGGGGHTNAAGAFVPGGDFDVLIDEAVKNAEKFL